MYLTGGNKKININEYKFFRENKFLQRPKIMQIEITNICPLNCPQCYKDEANTGYIELDRFIDIINDAKKSGVKAITLLGGEPFVHPDICRIIDILNNAGIEGGTYTSGYGINDEIISTIKSFQRPFYLFVSLNGSKESINALSRDGFDVTLNAMKNLCENDVNYGINWVARHDNILNLPQLIKMVKEYNAMFINVVCNKINAYHFVDSVMNRNDYKLLKNVFEDTRNNDFIKLQNCYSILKNYLSISNESVLSGCQAGISICAIDYKGRYLPCLHMNYPEQYDSINTYWIKSPTLASLRTRGYARNGDCITCLHKRYCKFCRAMSVKTHDNFMSGLYGCPISTTK